MAIGCWFCLCWMFSMLFCRCLVIVLLIRVVDCFCLVVCLVVRLMFFLLMTFDVFLLVLPDSLGCSSTGCCSFSALKSRRIDDTPDVGIPKTMDAQKPWHPARMVASPWMMSSSCAIVLWQTVPSRRPSSSAITCLCLKMLCLSPYSTYTENYDNPLGFKGHSLFSDCYLYPRVVTKLTKSRNTLGDLS